MAAIDLTSGPLPRFGTEASAGTTCTQIRAAPGLRVKVLADGACYVFNGVDQGSAAPAAALRWELSASEAAAGFDFIVGGAGPGVNYGTICIAAKTGTVSVRASAEDSE